MNLERKLILTCTQPFTQEPVVCLYTFMQFNQYYIYSMLYNNHFNVFNLQMATIRLSKLPLLPLQIKYSYNFSIITFIISNPHAFIKSCKILPQTMKGIYGMRITITITWWILSYFQYLGVILRKLKDKMLLERKRGWESKPRETQ